MDCLVTHKVDIGHKDLKVTLSDQKGQEVCMFGERDKKECFL